MKRKLFTEGSFIIPGHKDERGKCGVIGPCEYSFQVTLSGDDVRLQPPEMFIMDHQEIRDFFEKYGREMKGECLSCETIAGEAAKHFEVLFTDAHFADIGINRVVVRIGLVGGVSYTEAERNW